MKNTTQVETIYRAKKIDSDEWVEGSIHRSPDVEDGHFKDTKYFNYITAYSFTETGLHHKNYKIDPSTLSVHFTNSHMNDSEGTPIFASLSSDGNGGDEIEDEVVLFSSLTYSVVMVEKPYIGRLDMYQGVYKPYFNSFKVTGIHTVKEESC